MILPMDTMLDMTSIGQQQPALPTAHG